MQIKHLTVVSIAINENKINNIVLVKDMRCVTQYIYIYIQECIQGLERTCKEGDTCCCCFTIVLVTLSVVICFIEKMANYISVFFTVYIFILYSSIYYTYSYKINCKINDFFPLNVSMNYSA